MPAHWGALLVRARSRHRRGQLESWTRKEARRRAGGIRKAIGEHRHGDCPTTREVRFVEKTWGPAFDAVTQSAKRGSPILGEAE